MLLESFIAILIFSMGILAIVGMQASAIKNSADAKYRSEASLLANELLGKMWVNMDRTGSTPPQVALALVTLQGNFQGGAGTDGNAYTDWYSTVQATLPQAATYVPTVSFDPVVLGKVTVTVRWKAPSEPAAAAAHSYAVTAQIR
jgi:type IV pilus assembly protein PilV